MPYPQGEGNVRPEESTGGSKLASGSRGTNGRALLTDDEADLAMGVLVATGHHGPHRVIDNGNHIQLHCLHKKKDASSCWATRLSQQPAPDPEVSTAEGPPAGRRRPLAPFTLWHQSVLETGVRSDRAGGRRPAVALRRCMPLQLRVRGSLGGSGGAGRGGMLGLVGRLDS